MATDLITGLGHRALPIIVDLAQKRDLMTYGELARRLGVHHRIMSHVLGYIRDDICIKNNLPLLTALIVNAQSRRPGESFLPEGTDNLSEEQYKHKFEDHRNKVFMYPEWDAMLYRLGLEPLEK